MTIGEMHVMFRQLAQQMGMQTIHAILPNEIDACINVAVNDVIKKLIAENLGSVTMPIDENGELYAMVTCGSVPTFEVDVETGLLKEVTKRGEVYTETYGLTKNDVQSDK